MIPSLSSSKRATVPRTSSSSSNTPSPPFMTSKRGSRPLGSTTERSTKPRSDRTKSPRFLAGLNRSTKKNPGTPITKLAATKNMSIYTISKAVREDLGYKSFALSVRHLLTDKQKDARVARGKDMLNFIKSSSSPSLRFFSDEKLFNLDRTHNRQNTRWICQDPEDVPMVFKSKNPASVMVLGVISSDGDVMAPTSSPWASGSTKKFTWRC
eukprot:TRINITY_DN11174_c0_g1_i1.p1 TRINITY_DN11174_c0_g1~~TRINITY_DN11174_c0_g1_i1.p1  ORF type:complete len:211 (+),score=40.62 TRINITY_DN11174_c0_g1_i1:134-766(+)